jgi:hypothetical protein
MATALALWWVPLAALFALIGVKAAATLSEGYRRGYQIKGWVPPPPLKRRLQRLAWWSALGYLTVTVATLILTIGLLKGAVRTPAPITLTWALVVWWWTAALVLKQAERHLLRWGS